MPEPIRSRILKRVGRIMPKDIVKYALTRKSDDRRTWPNFGDEDTFHWVFKTKAQDQTLGHLTRLGKKKPNVLFIGAGQGEHLVPFKTELLPQGIAPEIDVFSLTETLSESVKKVVRKDYSRGKSFEEIITHPNENKDFYLANLGQYDLIVANLSIGVHTDYPGHNAFYSALMLAPKGKLILDVGFVRGEHAQTIFGKNLIGRIYNPRFRMEYLRNFVNKFTKYFNAKYGTNYQFTLERIPNTDLVVVTRLS